jgi:primosomal protein N' (replication factor Y)
MNVKKTSILRVAVPTPLRQTFDYLVPNDCMEWPLPGCRVRVPFQHRELVGIVLEIPSTPGIPLHKLKQAIELIDTVPAIPPDILELCLWAADYYHHPVGDVLDTALPVLLRQGKPVELATESYWILTAAGRALDVETLKRSPRQKDLLAWMALYPDGVTKRQLQEHSIQSTVFKTLVQKGYVETQKKFFLDVHSASSLQEEPLELNSAQQTAVTDIIASAAEFKIFLLDGVTGSGKTEVYLQTITETLARQKQVLVLVPEIGLTPQTIQRFRQRFSVEVVALHSGLSDKERLNAWITAKTGAAKIIIGTRSAIFSPFTKLGLIIVDEEHDLSFKQQEGFRYHARDLAIMRARALQIPIVLGSATASLETLCRAEQGRYVHLRLPERAGAAQPPSFQVMDIRKSDLNEGVSPQLLLAMQEHLSQGGQVMLFLNRRGFAPVLMCHTCGWAAKCKRCDARMTFHHEPRRLHCHHCDAQRGIFKKCEECGAVDLQIIGLGTERLELAVEKYFPNHSIARIDRDSTQRKGSMENLLDSIQRGDHQILIGTQMLAKGHHFPNVTLVGIIDTDGGFFSTDFRAIERMGQLILQVAGRAGRAEKAGTVIIQTRHPDHPLLQQLLRESYYYFATTLLKERAQAEMPPFAHLALFRAEAHGQEQALHFLQQIKQMVDKSGDAVPIWGPVPAPLPRRAGRFRVQLLMQAQQRPLLQRCLKRILPEIEKIPGKQNIRWSLDVDPLDMF